MAGSVWVKNNQHTMVRVTVVKPTEDGSKQTEIVEFRRERVDRMTGLLADRGYTQIDVDTLKLLLTNKVFKDSVDKKLFTVYETPPDDALSDAQRVIQLQSTIGELNAKIVELEGTIATMTARHAELFADFKDLQDSKGRDEGLADRIDELTGQLAEVQEAFDAYKIANPEKSEAGDTEEGTAQETVPPAAAGKGK